MTWFNNIVVFAMLYIVVLFCVLPIGVRTSDEAGEAMLPGQATSAPANPQMWRKAALTFAISAVLFALYYLIGYFNLIDVAALFGRGTE